MEAVRSHSDTKEYSVSLETGSEILKQGKYRMAYWFCILTFITILFYTPVFFSVSKFVGIFGLSSLVILASSFVKLNKTKQPESILKTTFSLIIFFIFSSLVINAPMNPSGYLLWSMLIIASSSFLLGIGWAIGYFIIMIIGLTIISVFHHYEFNLLGYLTESEVHDISPIGLYSFIKIGVPFLAVLLVLLDFIKNQKKIDDRLLENLEEKEGLIQKVTEKERIVSFMLDSSGDAIYELDANGMVLYANIEFEKIVGYPKNEIVGKNPHFLIPATHMKERMSNVMAQIRAKKRVIYDQFPIKNKDGQIIWVGQNTTMIFDEHGKMVKAICSARNISKQKETRNNLIFSKEKAEEASLAKARFLSSMSHEIRTPMNAIIGIIDLMETDNVSKEQVDSLKFSANNLLSLVNNILDYEKLENGKMKFRKSDFSLKNMVNHVEMGLKNLAQEKGLEFQVLLDEKLPPIIHGDSLRLSQILNNIVHNAIKFTKEGKVIVEILNDFENEERTDIYFSVTDTGLGIPRDKIDIILNGFGQSDNSTIREGAGLGLAISDTLLKLHRSSIKVESEVGIGSKFFFTISFVKTSGASKSELKGWAENKSLKDNCKNQLHKGKNILLVEDNLINQRITERMLKKWGFEVKIAENGKVAVEQVQKQNFDLILMDLQMPVMNGIEATRAIRQMGGKYSEIPMLALTASAVLEIKTEALEAGIDFFVTKPFRPDFLFEKIKEYLSNNQSSTSLNSKT